MHPSALLTVTVTVVLLLVNIFAFFLYGEDKRRARRGVRRIREATLLRAAACFGALGSLLGMYVFHHKTKHRQFTIGVPALLLVQVVLLAAAFDWIW